MHLQIHMSKNRQLGMETQTQKTCVYGVPDVSARITGLHTCIYIYVYMYKYLYILTDFYMCIAIDVYVPS